MKQKLHAHFVALGPRRFTIVAVILLIITDFLNGYYLKLYWAAKDISRVMVERSLRTGNVLDEISPATMNEMISFLNNSFYFILLVILLNNLFFYLFYLRRKLWAQGFVLFYTLSLAIFSTTLIFDNADLGIGWFIYNALTIPFYLYLFLGVKLLKYETTDLPVPETDS